VALRCPAAANAQAERPKESPLSFRIGGTDFTPGGFLDFESVFRNPQSSVQPFVGGNIGGAFQSTNFSVQQPFDVNGNGFLGGGFGGFFLPVPNTNIQIGPRFGIQGGNITGDIRMPAASPQFNYTVTTGWMAYQEAMVRIPVGNPFNESPRPEIRGFRAFNFYENLNIPHLTGSVGIAESGTSVKGVSAMFSFTDNVVRTGITFTAGFDVPVATFPGGVINLFGQYRGTQWISTVNIPGGVNIGSFTNEVDAGVIFTFTRVGGTWVQTRQ
jgi:hypothetical protein